MWKPRSSAARATSHVSVKQCITPPASPAPSSRMIESVSAAAASRMDHEGLPGLTRRPNVRAKARALPFEIPLQPVVVESGFADRDDLLPLRERDEIVDRRFGRALVIGMHTDGRIEILVRRRERMHRRPVDKVHGDAERVRDAGGRHRLAHRRQVGGKFGEIEMTVRIDEHGRQLSAISCQQDHIVCVGREEASDSPSSFSIVARAAAPVSSCVNSTPMPWVLLPCTPSGVIQTTLP